MRVSTRRHANSTVQTNWTGKHRFLLHSVTAACGSAAEAAHWPKPQSGSCLLSPDATRTFSSQRCRAGSLAN